MTEKEAGSQNGGCWARARVSNLALLVLILAIAVLTVNVWLLASELRQKRQSTAEHAFWMVSQPGFAARERAVAFQRLVASGNREWRSARLDNLEIYAISLAGSDLKQATFDNSNLSKSDLHGAMLVKSSLRLTDFTGCDLAQADLSEAMAYRAIFKGAKLNQAKARAAFLQEINAEGAQWLAGDLSEADCTMANFTGADLAGANLTGARLEGTVFKGANLSLARISDASIKDADFTNCNWWHARGFTSPQLLELKQKFAPGASAPESLKADYAKWEAAAKL